MMKDFKTQMDLTKVKKINIQFESRLQDSNYKQYELSITPRSELHRLSVHIKRNEDLPIVRANKHLLKIPHQREQDQGEGIGATIELDCFRYEIKEL